MYSKELEEKLLLYWEKIQNTTYRIGDWSILDEDIYSYIRKNKICNVSNIVDSDNGDQYISLETKDKYILIKYNPNFIAIKLLDTEYDAMRGDYSLLAINKNHFQENNSNKPHIKNIFKLFKFRLSLRAKKDLSYFN